MDISEFIHKKTGNIYHILEHNAINATNDRDGQIMVVYTRENKVFVREQYEFLRKFAPNTLANVKKYINN